MGLGMNVLCKGEGRMVGGCWVGHEKEEKMRTLYKSRFETFRLSFQLLCREKRRRNTVKSDSGSAGEMLLSACLCFGSIGGLRLWDYCPSSTPETHDNRVTILEVLNCDGKKYHLGAMQGIWVRGLIGFSEMDRNQEMAIPFLLGYFCEDKSVNFVELGWEKMTEGARWGRGFSSGEETRVVCLSLPKEQTNGRTAPEDATSAAKRRKD